MPHSERKKGLLGQRAAWVVSFSEKVRYMLIIGRSACSTGWFSVSAMSVR
jgi:hypothetical protein